MTISSDLDLYRPTAVEALAKLGYDVTLCDVEWLSGGGAHKNFKIKTQDGDAVLKVWNTMWESVGVIPPSAVVIENTKIASDLGIGARVLGTTTEPMSLMLEFVASTPLTTDDENWDTRLAASARRLHDSGARFARDYSPFAEARTMFAAARQRDTTFPESFGAIASEMAQIESVLDLRFNEFVPCHNDLYSPNVLQTPDGGIRLIDYDLSGNGDRCYDLGFAAAYFEMDPDTVARFCESYFGHHDEHLVSRVRLFSAAADWAAIGLWLVASSMADTNDDYDYEGELQSSLRRIEAAVGSQSFAHIMDRARR